MQRSTRSRPTSSHSFASELVGLIARKDTSASKHTNKIIKDSFARILSSHITAAFHKWFRKQRALRAATEKQLDLQLLADAIMFTYILPTHTHLKLQEGGRLIGGNSPPTLGPKVDEICCCCCGCCCGCRACCGCCACCQASYPLMLCLSKARQAAKTDTVAKVSVLEAACESILWSVFANRK